jgi:hypothetical protein
MRSDAKRGLIEVAIATLRSPRNEAKVLEFAAQVGAPGVGVVARVLPELGTVVSGRSLSSRLFSTGVVLALLRITFACAAPDAPDDGDEHAGHGGASDAGGGSDGVTGGRAGSSGRGGTGASTGGSDPSTGGSEAGMDGGDSAGQGGGCSELCGGVSNGGEGHGGEQAGDAGQAGEGAVTGGTSGAGVGGSLGGGAGTNAGAGGPSAGSAGQGTAGAGGNGGFGGSGGAGGNQCEPRLECTSGFGEQCASSCDCCHTPNGTPIDCKADGLCHWRTCKDEIFGARWQCVDASDCCSGFCGSDGWCCSAGSCANGRRCCPGAVCDPSTLHCAACGELGQPCQMLPGLPVRSTCCTGTCDGFVCI